MVLKVLQILPALNEGGVERGTLEICEHLVQRGHSAYVVSGGGRLVDTLSSIGAQHICWPIGRKSPLTLKWVRPLRRLLLEEKVDIVHARSRLPAWIAYLAWRGMPQSSRPRFVTTVHGFYSVNAYSAIMTRGERVIAVSDAIRDYVRENYPKLDMDRVNVIYRGVDDKAYPRGYQPSAQWLAQWHAEKPVEIEGKFTLLLPGRLRRLKGHEALLDLMSVLSKEGLPVHALIAGDDQSDSEYIRDIKRRIIDEALPVSFLGYRSDLKELYAVVDLVLSLSTQPESFGRTVLEPLCIGTPVIGYAQGGVGEILKQMYPEGAVPADEPGLLVDKVKALLRKPVEVTADNAYPLITMQCRTVDLYERLNDMKRAYS